MPRRKPRVDPDRAEELRDNALVSEGYKILIREDDGRHVEKPDWDAFKKAIDEIVVAMSDATTSTKSKKGRTFHSILMEILPNLRVDNLDLEEEWAYAQLLQTVSRRCSTAPSGAIQSQLVGRVLCKGDLLTKSGRIKGVWITSSPSPTGPLAEAWEEEIRSWAKRVKSLTDYGRMATTRVPAFSDHAVAALESHVAQVNAALDVFKRQAISAGSAPAEIDAADDELDDDDDELETDDGI